MDISKQAQGWTPQVGDVLLIWGKGFSAKMVRFLIYLLFGIKKPPNHVQIVATKDEDLSAEVKGVGFVSREETMKHSKKVLIARHKKITGEIQEKLLAIEREYLGKRYDFFLYVLWYLRVSLVFAPLVWLIFQPLRNWLRREEKKSYTCSELVSEVLSRVDVIIGIDDHTNATPSDIHQVIKACENWEVMLEIGANK